MILAKFNMNEKKTNVDMNEKKTNHIRSRPLFLSGARLCSSATQQSLFYTLENKLRVAA